MPREDRYWEREKKEAERGKELIKGEERRTEERREAYRQGQGKGEKYDKDHGIRPA